MAVSENGDAYCNWDTSELPMTCIQMMPIRQADRSHSNLIILVCEEDGQNLMIAYDPVTHKQYAKL